MKKFLILSVAALLSLAPAYAQAAAPDETAQATEATATQPEPTAQPTPIIRTNSWPEKPCAHC